MRDKLVEYQKETGSLYNLEATPAESTAYRLCQKDKKKTIHRKGRETTKTYYMECWLMS